MVATESSMDSARKEVKPPCSSTQKGHTQMEHPFQYAPGLHSAVQSRGIQELEQVFAFARVAFWNTVQARMLHRSLSSFRLSSYRRKVTKWGRTGMLHQ